MTKATINVKVTTGNPELSHLLLRQTPGYTGRWGSCQFFVNQAVESCDWWFVCHDSALKGVERANCDPDHVVYISMEPIDSHPSAFYAQFSGLVLCDRKVKHPRIDYRNATTWWAGINVDFNGGHSFSPSINEDYDSLKILEPPDKKLDRISIITSNKTCLPGHKQRLAFIERLMRSDLAGVIDFYGGGHNPIKDKMRAILPYKYHIALENSVLENYWSEKIGDAYLGYALPLYHGCTNINQYFPSQSLVKLDLDSESVIADIAECLSGDLYSQRLEAIKAARNLVMNDHNIFALMSSIAKVKASRIEPCEIKGPGKFWSIPRKVKTKVAILSKKYFS